MKGSGIVGVGLPIRIILHLSALAAYVDGCVEISEAGERRGFPPWCGQLPKMNNLIDKPA